MPSFPSTDSLCPSQGKGWAARVPALPVSSEPGSCNIMQDFLEGGIERTQHPVYDEEWTLCLWSTPGAWNRGANTGKVDRPEDTEQSTCMGYIRVPPTQVWGVVWQFMLLEEPLCV